MNALVHTASWYDFTCACAGAGRKAAKSETSARKHALARSNVRTGDQFFSQGALTVTAMLLK